jgi:hypothetical protein
VVSLWFAVLGIVHRIGMECCEVKRERPVHRVFTGGRQVVTQPIGSSSECHLGLWGTQPLAAPALRSQELADQPAAGSIPAALFCSALAHPTIATAAVNNAAVNEWVSLAPTKKGAA